VTESEAVAGHTTPVPSKEKSSFAADVLKLASGATIAQALGVLLSPVLSRLFSPEAFGTAAVFTSITTVIGVVVCLRYELAIMLPEKDEDAVSLLVGSLFFVGMFTVLTTLGVVLLHEPICRWLKAPELEPFLWLVPISVFLSGVALALRYWNTRLKRFGLLSGLRVAASVSASSVRLGTGFLGYVGSGSLIASSVLSQVVSAVGLGWEAWRGDRSCLSQTSWGHIGRELKRYHKFPLVNTWSGLLNTVSLQIPTMLLSAFFSQTVVGYYSLGTRVIQLPMVLIGGAIGQVFFQRASQALNEGNLGMVVQSTYKRLVSLGLFPLLVLGLIGQEVFVVVLGPQWAEAGVYAQIISLWRFFVFVGSPMSILFSVLERQEIGLVFNIILFISRILSLTIGGRLGNARLALALYAGSGLVMWVVLLLWLFRMSGASMRRSVLYMGRCLVYAAPVLLFLFAAKWWWQWSAYGILALAGIGTLVYYGVIIQQDRSLMKAVFAAWDRVRSKL